MPGGYFQVCTTRTIGPAGGTIGPLPCDGVRATVRIPPGAFPTRLQVTLTAPNLAAIGSAGFPGYQAVGGLGVNITRNGRTFRGFFNRLVNVTMASPAIHWSSIVVAWYGDHWVQWTNASVRQGLASVWMDVGDPDFAVLSPAHGHRPGRPMHGHPGITPGRKGHGGTGRTGGFRSGISTRHRILGMRPGEAMTHRARSNSAATATLTRDKAKLAADTTSGSRNPLLLEGLLTAVLLVMGGGGLVFARRRRAGAHPADTSGS